MNRNLVCFNFCPRNSLSQERGAPIHPHGFVDVETESFSHGQVHVAKGKGDMMGHVLRVVEPKLVLLLVMVSGIVNLN